MNEAWEEGVASSIRIGVGAFIDADGVLLMTCDQPAVTADHLRALTVSGEVRASGYAGRRGVPAYFPASWFPQLMRLCGEAGARELLRGAATVELADGELDVDTDRELARVRELFG
jgi:CTP:molybdopterin cytidylyltransferase MocA